MLITHIWITQVHRFWKAKAQHASPTPQLSSSSYIARALQHRAIACGLEHQASATLSRFGAVESAQRFLHLWFMAPDKNTTRSSSEALTSTLQAQEQRICSAAPITAAVTRLCSAPSHLHPVHRLCELTSGGRYRCSSVA